MSPPPTTWLAALWFVFTYVGLALGRVPGLRMDRAGVAFVGAALVLVTGVLTLPEAVEAVNADTILLLLGMMIVVGHLRLAGFFERLAGWVLPRFRRPPGLLAVVVVLSGVLSAFLVNDVVCVALTPLVVHLARRLRLNPVPYLIGLATAANVGSTATMTGNPQNMIIGSLSHIPYAYFAARLAPVAAAGLLINFAVIAFLYRGRLTADDGNGETSPAAPGRVPNRKAHARLLAKSLAVTVACVLLFFTGLPVALVAMGGAAVLLLGRVRPGKTYREIDWGLLVMFSGLFVVVHAFDVAVVQHWGLARWRPLLDHPVGLLSLISAALSNLVSNVPAVLLFKPVLAEMDAHVRQTAWLALAMSSTFAGNLTVLGSVANLIVVEGARREGVEVSFAEYSRVGIPVTLLTLVAGAAWLQWVSY